MATRDKYPLNAAGIPLITAYNGSFCLFGGKVGGCSLVCYIYTFSRVTVFFESNGVEVSFVISLEVYQKYV